MFDGDGWLETLEVRQDGFALSFPIALDSCGFGDDEEDDKAFDAAMLATAHKFAASSEMLSILHDFVTPRFSWQGDADPYGDCVFCGTVIQEGDYCTSEHCPAVRARALLARLNMGCDVAAAAAEVAL